MLRTILKRLARRPISSSTGFTSRAMSAAPNPAATTTTTAAAAAAAPVPVKTEKARRHQHHLNDVMPPTSSSVDQQQAEQAQAEQQQTEGFVEWRGGPQTLEELTLRVVSKDPHFLVLNKGPDERLDGDFQVTIEKALARDFPEVEKFRWIHQLDFATSGLMCVGVERDATALACRLFREKRVQKEYLAVVRGHLPFHPADYIKSLSEGQQSQDEKDGNVQQDNSKHKQTDKKHNVKRCTLSKLGWLIQDTEEFERLKGQQKGSQVHQKDPKYPRGVHHGPSLFHMEKSRIMKERKAQGVPLTEEEQTWTALKWRDLPRDQQEPFKQRGQADKERFVSELTQFLDEEREKVAKKRKYEAVEGSSDDDGVKQAKDEPVAYVFDDRIAEPSGELFRMQIGDKEKPGKGSSTIAFVLGHGMRTINNSEEEPVTKVLLRPLTGRRHQLRLHLAHNGFPILGDVTYGDESDDSQRMMLHAWKLWLMAPPEAQKQYGDLFFTSPDPFEDIVPSEREITTMTYHRQKKQKQEQQQQQAPTEPNESNEVVAE